MYKCVFLFDILITQLCEGEGHCWSSFRKPDKVFGKATARRPTRLFRPQRRNKGAHPNFNNSP